jgi:hypothetical protein
MLEIFIDGIVRETHHIAPTVRDDKTSTNIDDEIRRESIIIAEFPGSGVDVDGEDLEKLGDGQRSLCVVEP